AKEIPIIPRRTERCDVEIVLGARLGPHEEERRPRTVLPAQYGARVELFLVESLQRRGARVWTKARVVRRGAGVGQLARVEVLPRRHERLRVQLQRKVGRHRVVETSREAEQVLVEVREDVVRRVSADRAEV